MEIEIKEEVQIGDIILEAGDKIQVLSESKWFAMTPFSDGSQAFFYQVDTDNIYSITVVNGKAKKATKVGKNALKTAYPTPEETEETDVPVMAVKKMKVRLGENVLSIIQFNIVAGTYAFLDNDDYLEGNIRFQKMTGYDRLLIDNTPVALEEFDIAFR